MDNVRMFTAFGLGIVADMETVRDAVQEAFITLWNRHGMLHPEEKAKAWIYTSIHNNLLNVVRSRRMMDRHADGIREQYGDQSFRDMVIESEMYEYLCRRIESLPPMQQKVIRLHADGLSNEQIAKELGVTVNTVLTHKQRARSELREYRDKFSCAAVLLALDFFSQGV